jgi:hypothetical protein
MANVTPDVFENFSLHSSDSDIVRIRTAGRTVIQSIGEGDFGPMQKVLSVHELSANLFSVRSCCLNGFKVLFSQDKCEIFESPDIVSYSLLSCDDSLSRWEVLGTRGCLE